MKTKVIGYWATTTIVAFVLLVGGAAQLAHRPENVEAWLTLATRCTS